MSGMARGRSLVGRAHEIESLKVAAARALEGRSQVVVVEGGSGVGKSFLIEEFQKGLEGWRTVRIVHDQSDIDARLDSVARICEVLLSERVRVEDVESAAVQLLRAIDGQKEPLCLVIEDVQWTDPQSLEALWLTVRRLGHTRVLVILTSHSSEDWFLQRARRHASQPSAGAALSLPAWTQREVAEYVRLSSHLVPRAADLRAMMTATGGVPVYVDSLVRRLNGAADEGKTLETILTDVVHSHRKRDSIVAAEVEATWQRLGEPDRAALLALALAGDLGPAQLQQVVRQHTGATVELDPFEDNPLVVVTPERTLRCRHGVIAARIEFQSPDDEVTAMHRTLGACLGGIRSLRHRFLAQDPISSEGLVADLWEHIEAAVALGDADSACSMAEWAATIDRSLLVRAALVCLWFHRSEKLDALRWMFEEQGTDWAGVAFRALQSAEDRQSAADIDKLTPGDLASMPLDTLLLIAYAVFQVCRLQSSKGSFADTTPALVPTREEVQRRLAGSPDARARGPLLQLEYELRMWECFRGTTNATALTVVDRLERLLAEARGAGAREAIPAIATLTGSLSFIACRFASARAAFAEAASTGFENPDFDFTAATKSYLMEVIAGKWDLAHREMERALGQSLSGRHDVGSVQLSATSALVPLCRGEVEVAGEALARVRSLLGNAEYSSAVGGAALTQAWGLIALRGPSEELIRVLGGLWETQLGGAFAGLPTAIPLVKAMVAEGQTFRARKLVDGLVRFEVDADVRDYVIHHCELHLAGDNLEKAWTHAEAAREKLFGLPGRDLRLFEVMLAEDRAVLAAKRQKVTPAVEADLRESIEFLRRVRALPWAAALDAIGLKPAGAESEGTGDPRPSADARGGGTHARAATPAPAPAAGQPSSPRTPEPDALPDLLIPLTSRERDVALRIADGMSNREVADEDFLSVRTVEFHVRNVLKKTGLSSRVELRRAIRAFQSREPH